MTSFYDHSVASVERDTRAIQPGSFWRKDDPILDASGRVIKGGLFSHQRAVWDLPNFIKVFVGGFGSGKTLLLGKRAISLTLENAPCPVAIVCPTNVSARRTMIPTLIDLLWGKETIYGPGAFSWDFNQQYNVFTIRFRGRVGRLLILSAEEPKGLRGANLAAVLFDEPFIMKEEVFHHMVARVRHPDAKIREMVLGGTPEQLNWGYELCVGELSERHDVGVVHASSRLNRALDSNYVTRLEGSFTGKAAEAFIEGEFVNLSTGLVYYGFSRTDNVATYPVNLEYAKLGCGMDFNVNPMAGVVFAMEGNHMHFFHEIELANADTEFMCGYLRENFPTLNDVYPDPTGKARHTSSPMGRSDFWYLEDAGFEIHARRKSSKRRDRYNAANGKLKPLKGEVTITIDPKCKRLIKYLMQYAWENLTKQESMSHLLDAFSYPVDYLFPIVRPEIKRARLSGF